MNICKNVHVLTWLPNSFQ